MNAACHCHRVAMRVLCLVAFASVTLHRVSGFAPCALEYRRSCVLDGERYMLVKFELELPRCRGCFASHLGGIRCLPLYNHVGILPSFSVKTSVQQLGWMCLSYCCIALREIRIH
jgi:hypothetical protein